MRPDVKLGVVLSMFVVLVAGGYFIYRGNNEAPVQVVDGADSLTGQAAQKPSEATPSQPSAAGADRARRTSPTPAAAGRSAQPGLGRVAQSGRRAADGANRGRPQGTRPLGTGTSAVARRGGITPRQPGTPPAQQPRSGQRGGARVATGTPQPRSNAENQPNNDRGSRRTLAGSTKTSPTVPGTTSAGSRVADANRRQSGANRGTPDRSAPHRAAPSSRPIALTGTPTPAADRHATAAANAAVDTHLVQMGDTLSSLARRYYGSERYTQFLVDSNSHLENPNHLAIGSRVKIPPRPSDASARTSGTAARSSSTTTQPPGSTTAGRGSSTTTSTQGRTYKVQSGDSFYTIARDVLHDHARWSELFELNKELVKGDARNLQIGQVITLPPG